MMDEAIRNCRYTTPDGSVIDLEVDHPVLGWIPFSAGQNDTEEIGKLLYDAAISGGNVSPYVPPPPLTADQRRAAMPSVSARQLRLTLVRNGFSLASIDAAISALPAGQQKDEALIEWEYAHEFQRISPTLNSIADALGLTPSIVDLMWAQALTA